MNRKPEIVTILKLLVSIGVGGLGAVVCWLTIPAADIVSALLFCLLLSILSELGFLIFDATKYRTSYLSVHSILENALERQVLCSSFGRFILGLQLQSIRSDKGMWVNSHGVWANASTVEELWRQIPVHIESSLDIVSYVNPDEWQLDDYVRWAVIKERRLVEDNKRVCRIFLHDDGEVAPHVQQLICSMRDSGISVSEITQTEVARLSGLRAHHRILNTWDFAIVDNKWVISTILNRRRIPMSLEVTNQELRLNAGKNMLDVLRTVHNSRSIIGN